jgi:hypothetical protein
MAYRVYPRYKGLSNYNAFSGETVPLLKVWVAQNEISQSIPFCARSIICKQFLSFQK